MSQPADERADKQLRTLERWNTLEVEVAQALHAAQQLRERQDQAVVDATLAQIDEVHALTRTQLSSAQPLSPEALLRMTQYLGVQEAALREAQETLRKTQSAVEEARAELLRKTERLFGVERLRERRANEASIQRSRREQRQLDDLALLRVTIKADQKTRE